VMNAYREMIAQDSFPLYVLFIDLDPAQLDINVHPTKQEIKFEDEKIVYAFVQAAVKHALAQFSISPTLDFDLDPSIQQLDAVSKPVTEENKAAAAASSLYQTFSKKNQAHFIEPSNKSELKHWREFYESPADQKAADLSQTGKESGSEANGHTGADNSTNWFSGENQPGQEHTRTKMRLVAGAQLQQLRNTYITAHTNRGFILIHQQSAHERILYERYVAAAAGKGIPSQQSMFPATIHLSPPDAILLNDLMEELQTLGFMIEIFGKDTFLVRGTPADTGQGNERSAVESLLEQFKHFSSELKFSKREKLVRSMARQQAVRPGTPLDEKEMRSLTEELFASAQPNITPGGDPTYVEFKDDYLERLFGR
jgi:DNA mismatch repair protein MutL